MTTMEENNLLREMLEKFEWLYLNGIRSDIGPICGECRGTKNPHPYLAWSADKLMQGHRTGCKIARALGRTTDPHDPHDKPYAQY